MKRLLFVTLISIFALFSSFLLTADPATYGINIDQESFQILKSAVERLNKILYVDNTHHSLSVKAKVIAKDVISDKQLKNVMPNLIADVHLKLFRLQPDYLRLDLESNFIDLLLLSRPDVSLIAIPSEGIYTKVDLPQFIPETFILKEDDGGLFTLINLLGGIPFGSLFYLRDGIQSKTNINIVEEIPPEDLRATIRYRGTDVIDGKTSHVITINSTLYRQYMKIWILRDTLEVYQISLEDERGSEVFIVIKELEGLSVERDIDFTPDLSGMTEIDNDQLKWSIIVKILTSTPIEHPLVLDLYASYHIAPRTGSATISADGFDLQDSEDKLTCEIQYRRLDGTWMPLATEYVGIPPIGHWNAEFVATRDMELGPYSFRVRFKDTSGNASDWLESNNLVTVTPEPPRVVKTYPNNFELNVSTSTNISITFNKPMDKVSVEKAFALSYKGKVIQGMFHWEGNTMIFVPFEELNYDTSYIARIKGTALDTEGIGLDGNYDSLSDGEYIDDYVWQFVTSKVRSTLTFSPIAKKVHKGDRFDVNITVKNIESLLKFSLSVKYDPASLQVEHVVKRSFLEWNPRSKVAQDSDLWKPIEIDDLSGSLKIECDKTVAEGASGSGQLVTITFKSLAFGHTSVAFDNVSMFDINGRPIAVALNQMDVISIEADPLDKNKDGVIDILDIVRASKEDKLAPVNIHFSLGQNYPNPFNPETWIPYSLSSPSEVTIRIYAIDGRLVRTLSLGYKEPGVYYDKQTSAYWDGTDELGQKVSSGVYFYIITAGDFVSARKMIMLR